MVALLVVLVLAVAALCAGWLLISALARPGDDVRAAAAPTEHPVPAPCSVQRCTCWAPTLTEDDLISFGLQIEASDDVVAELVGRRG